MLMYWLREAQACCLLSSMSQPNPLTFSCSHLQVGEYQGAYKVSCVVVY